MAQNDRVVLYTHSVIDKKYWYCLELYTEKYLCYPQMCLHKIILEQWNNSFTDEKIKKKHLSFSPGVKKLFFPLLSMADLHWLVDLFENLRFIY